MIATITTLLLLLLRCTLLEAQGLVGNLTEVTRKEYVFVISTGHQGTTSLAEMFGHSKRKKFKAPKGLELEARRYIRDHVFVDFEKIGEHAARSAVPSSVRNITGFKHAVSGTSRA